MKKNENKRQRQASGKQRKPYNRELSRITYLFTGLFVVMIGYFVYFQMILSPDVINNPYNSRQETFAKRVVRGSILASDGSILAETTVLHDGTEVRSYPYANIFSHAVGYSTRGNTGLESLTNFHLLTSNAYFGEKLTNEIREEKNIGDNVVSTFDVNLQKAAYDALGNHKGAVVVLEADTGKVLSMVSKPDFDPNSINEEWDTLIAESQTKSALYNRAAQGQYAPGSTFKIITLLEYMRQNKNYENFLYHCNGRLQEEAYTLHCYGENAHGDEDLRKAFAKSCNTAFASIGLSLNQKSLEQTCKGLLFNTALPLDIPYSESQILLSDTQSNAGQMMTAIGQGETLVTPFHMAMITASIANHGILMKPYFVDRIENYTGGVIKRYHPSALVDVMTAEEAAALTEYMEAVVEEGTASKLKELGFPVAGKTGTAEYSNDKNKSHAWFTGFSNTGDSDIVVCVLVEETGSGSEYAVPVALSIFETWNGNLRMKMDAKK